VSTVVAVTDRAGFDANTDNIVVVDAARRELVWMPRDLWCPACGDRINTAYRRRGHDGLVDALREHGVLVAHSLVVSRAATEQALDDVSVLVPVPAPMAFDYPLTPTSRIEDGRKRITFKPPAEVLRGERIHQWIGARGSDLHRIERQKVLIRRLLELHFDFNRAMHDRDRVRLSHPDALDDLRGVDTTWQFTTFGPTDPVTIDGKQVLVSAAAGTARVTR
jgi:hypothetical protein